MKFPNWFELGFALLAIVTVAACQVTPTTPAPPSKPTQVAQLDPQAKLARAERSSPGEASRLRLEAARAFFDNGEIVPARTAIDLVVPDQLDNRSRFNYYELQAQLALLDAQYDVASAALAMAVPADTAQRNRRALTSADLAEMQQHYFDAAAAMMAIDYSQRDATSDAQAWVDRTWSDVNRVAADRMSSLAATNVDATSAAWWELGIAMQRSFDLASERAAIAAWRTQHPRHPAAVWPPTPLRAIESDLSAPTRIALLLPVTGSLENAGRAVRDGFLAAYFHGGANATVHVYDTNGADIGSLYEQAGSDGAQVVVGPLQKPDVATMNAVGFRTIPVIALNYLPAGVVGSPGLIQFGLAIEDEARAIAQRLSADGIKRIVLLQSDVDWSDRAGRAFRADFENAGGVVVAGATISDPRTITDVVGTTLLVAASTSRMETLAQLIGTQPEFTPRRRADVDAVVALVDPSQARALNPAMAFFFASELPIYATSQATTGIGAGGLAELDGFRTTQLPWQVYPSVVRDEIYAAFSNVRTDLSALYALGVDAYRLADRAELLAQHAAGGLLGETGQLSIESSGAIVRQPAWAVVSHGRLVALPSVVF